MQQKPLKLSIIGPNQQYQSTILPNQFIQLAQKSSIILAYILKTANPCLLYYWINRQKNQSLLLKSQTMNRSKHSISQLKIKPKLHLSNSCNPKSATKIKQKLDRPSPRTNNIHTLQTKKSSQVLKKTKLNIEITQSLREHTPSNRQNIVGYETPKFKCQIDKLLEQKKPPNLHNFFSFGERQSQKQPKNKKTQNLTQTDKQFSVKTQVKQRVNSRKPEGYR